MSEIDVLDDVISTIDNSVRKTKYFIRKREEVVPDVTVSLKSLYDFTKKQSQRKTNALPELLTEGLDEEQVWQQLELQHEGEFTYLLNTVSKLLFGRKHLRIPVTSIKPEPVQIKNDSPIQENEGISDDKESEDESSETENNSKKRKHDIKKKKKKCSIVDDKFFKLQELDEYLTKEEKKQKQEEEDVSSDEESLDLFNDEEEDDDSSSEGKYFKYADFFDSPQSDDERLNDSKTSEYDSIKDSDQEELESEGEEMSIDEEEEEPLSKKVRFNLTNDSDETDSLENKVNDKEGTAEEDDEPKSTLEARRKRLLTRIKELEEEAIGEKPWQLKGEVSGTIRPQNSLLQEFVEFDVTARPAPVITEKTTIKLEDIIKQRIKDKAWDDVEKKFKPVETPLEYKKKLILDQEKSKESLSQIYEKEYLKQKQALNPENNEKEEEMPELHKEIQEKMHFLLAKLDALSNYHYTPKQTKPELKVISNVPAISMEEVAPVATSDAVMLAPEEVRAKSQGDLIGKSERTKTDMKRERRRKKLKQRSKQQAIESKDKLKSGINKKDKDKVKLLNKLTKDRNITKLNETNDKIMKSSTAFFTQLQDQVKSHIKGKAGSLSKNRDKSIVSAVKLKL